MVDLDPVMGSEQSGRRPVLVVSEEIVNQSLPILTVLPITSHKGRKIYPNEYLLSKNDSGLSKDSIVMAHQIRTISKERMLFSCGMISNENIRDMIRDAIRFQLDLVT
jgi:mRNA interferase MazF